MRYDRRLFTAIDERSALPLCLAKCVNASPPNIIAPSFFGLEVLWAVHARAITRCNFPRPPPAASHSNHAPRRRPAPGPQHLPEQASGGRRRREDPLRHGRHEVQGPDGRRPHALRFKGFTHKNSTTGARSGLRPLWYRGPRTENVEHREGGGDARRLTPRYPGPHRLTSLRERERGDLPGGRENIVSDSA